MRSITNSAVLAAVSVGVLMGAAGQASAEAPHRPGPVSESTGSSSGSAGPLLKALLCALQGGVTGSHETSPPTCYLPTA